MNTEPRFIAEPLGCHLPTGPEPDHRQAVLRPGLRHFARGGCAVTACMALELQPGMRALLVAGCLLLALGFAAAVLRCSSACRVGTVVLGVGWAASAITALTAVGIGEGVHSLSLGFFGLMVCLVTVLTSVRAGLVLALACAAAIAALAWAESRGWLPGAAAVQRNPNLLNVVLHALMLLHGGGGGHADVAHGRPRHGRGRRARAALSQPAGHRGRLVLGARRRAALHPDHQQPAAPQPNPHRPSPHRPAPLGAARHARLPDRCSAPSWRPAAPSATCR